MPKTNTIIDVMSLLVLVGGVLVMVRPGSQGPELVKAITNGFTGALATATGSGIPDNFQPISWH